MTERKTYYEILGVSPDSSINEIKNAYRNLMRKMHPDKINNKKQISNYVTRINKAYDILKNPHKRMEYDRILNKSFDNSDFFKLKTDFKNFINIQAVEPTTTLTKEMTPTTPTFETIKEIKPTDEEILEEIGKLEILREQEYIENTPEKICDDNLTTDKFNKIFEKQYSQMNKKITTDVVEFNYFNPNEQFSHNTEYQILESYSDEPYVHIARTDENKCCMDIEEIKRKRELDLQK